MGPTYTVSQRDYDEEGLDPDVTSRNALRHTMGFTSQWRWKSPAGSSARFSLSASAQRNDADGSDFEFDGTVYGASLDLPLTRRSSTMFSGVSLQASTSFSDQDYDEFAVLPRRRDRRLSASVSLGVLVKPLGALELSFTHLDMDSNRAVFDASRNVVRVGVTHTL